MSKNRAEKSRQKKARKAAKRKSRLQQRSASATSSTTPPEGRVVHIPSIAATGQMFAVRDEDTDILTTWAFFDEKKAGALLEASATPLRLDTVNPITFLQGVTSTLSGLGIDLVVVDDEIPLATTAKGAAVAAQSDPRWHMALERGLIPVVATRILTEHVAGVRTPLGLDDDPVRFVCDKVEDTADLQPILDQKDNALIRKGGTGPDEGTTFVVRVTTPASGPGSIPIMLSSKGEDLTIYSADPAVTRAVYTVMGEHREGYLHMIQGGEKGCEFHLDTHRLLENPGW